MGKAHLMIKKTKAFLKTEKGHWPHVAMQVAYQGVEITPQWISKFMKGDIKEPGINKILAILEYAKKVT